MLLSDKYAPGSVHVLEGWSQAWVLQDCCFTRTVGHADPPPTGCVAVRVCFWVPVPHGFVQSLHSPQADITQSTGSGGSGGQSSPVQLWVSGPHARPVPTALVVTDLDWLQSTEHELQSDVTQLTRGGQALQSWLCDVFVS